MTLRRHNPDVHDEAFAAFVDDVRAAVPSPPQEETARRHLAAMRAAAEESRAGATASGAGPTARAGRRRSAGPGRAVLRLGAVTAGAVAAFSGVSTGLAAAGVELPDPVRAPFEAVGIELPNQPDDARGTRPSQDDRRDAEPSDGDARGGEAGRERPGERGRSGERRGDGHARGREGTQPGKDGTRGRSEEHRRDDTAPNDDGAPRGGASGDRRGGSPSSRSRSYDRPAHVPRPKPKRPRPTGPKQRIRREPAPKRRTAPAPPAAAPDTAAEVAPPTTTTTTSSP
jgi:hypothetical protein